MLLSFVPMAADFGWATRAAPLLIWALLALPGVLPSVPAKFCILALALALWAFVERRPRLGVVAVMLAWFLSVAALASLAPVLIGKAMSIYEQIGQYLDPVVLAYMVTFAVAAWSILT